MTRARSFNGGNWSFESCPFERPLFALDHPKPSVCIRPSALPSRARRRLDHHLAEGGQEVKSYGTFRV